jgi:hypothetical protein
MPTTPYFSLSPNLKVTATNHQFTIRHFYKHRLFLSIFTGLVGVTMLTLTVFMVTSPYARSQPSSSSFIIFLLIVTTGFLIAAHHIYFSQRVLHIFSDSQSILVQKGNRKYGQSQFSFHDIAHWQLKGYMQYVKGHQTFYTALSICLKSHKKKVHLFQLHVDINHKNYFKHHKLRNDAYQKGKQVCDKLHDLTGISWQWIDYP